MPISLMSHVDTEALLYNAITLALEQLPPFLEI